MDIKLQEMLCIDCLNKWLFGQILILSDQSVYSQLYLLIFGKSVCCLGILSYSSYPKMCSLSDAFDVCQAILHI